MALTGRLALPALSDKRTDCLELSLRCLPALDIQVEELGCIAFNVLDGDGLCGRDDECTALTLVLPDVFALLVVAIVARGDGVEEIGVLGIAGICCRHELVRALFVVAILGEDYDCAVEAGIFQYMLHRHGVGDSAIKVEMPVELDNRGDKW